MDQIISIRNSVFEALWAGGSAGNEIIFFLTFIGGIHK